MSTLSTTKQEWASCLYEGTLEHRRLSPKRHGFRYRLFLMYLDLDELPRLFARRWLWSDRRAAAARFRRSDYPGDPSEPLAETIRNRVERDIGHRPRGPVRLLTHLRYFGYGFNPASFFYCFDRTGTCVEAILVHVTSTPWGQTHSYVIDARDRTDDVTASLQKRLHVSPFLPMDLVHEFRFSPPASSLRVRIRDRRGDECVFVAGLTMHRREITTASLAWALCRYPFLTARVIAAIYAHALVLYCKKVPFHPHPAAAGTTGANR